MNSILDLFILVSSYIAIATMLLPIIADLMARKKNVTFKNDLKLFEFYIYFTFILQIAAIGLRHFGEFNVFLFRLYLPIHSAIFAYLLLKWLFGKNKYIILLVIIPVIFSVLGDILTSEKNTFPNFMLLFDAVLLFILSYLVSFINDKRKNHLPNEYNFIHIGIYLYSILTLVGFLLTQTGYIDYGYFIQAIAVIISNYYFAWSFICLFRSRG